jgi:fused signal recognition particle receptor
MAIGFIKKIFSFGKDAVEEKPVPPQEAADAASVTAATPPSVPSGHLPHKEGEQGATAAAAEDGRAVSPEPSAREVEAKSDEAMESTGPAAGENAAVEDESAPPPIPPPAGEMPGKAEGGEPPSDHTTVPVEAPIPSSVPSGHLPLKGEEQRETEVVAEDNRTAFEEAADDRAASSDTATPWTETAETAKNIGPAAGEDLAGQNERAPRPIFPLVGEMPGRAEEGAPSSDEAPTPPSVPLGHLPLKGGEQSEPAAPSLPKGFATADKRLKEEALAPQPKLNWYQRLRRGLSRTSSQLTGQIASLFTKRKLDEATLEDLEDLLIQADLGVETAMRITDTLSSERYGKDVTGEDVSRIMAGEITKVLAPVAKPLELDLSHKPHVILVDRQARRQALRRRPQGDAGGRRHLPRRGDRAIEDLGRTNEVRHRRVETRRRCGRPRL